MNLPSNTHTPYRLIKKRIEFLEKALGNQNHEKVKSYPKTFKNCSNMKPSYSTLYKEKKSAPGLWTLAWLCLASMLFNVQLNAQCNAIVCNGNLASPLSVSVNQVCQAAISADAILEGNSCVGPKTLVATTLLGDFVASGADSVIIPETFLGSTLNIQVIDDNTGNNCTGVVILEDKLAPVVIACPTDTVTCAEAIDTSNIADVIFEDNCDNDLMVSFTDAELPIDCSPLNPFITSIIRIWEAEDDNGNMVSCNQLIMVIAPDTIDVVFPDDVTLDCDGWDADPTITGEPTINGNPISLGAYCSMTVTFEDIDTLDVCPAAMIQIIRNWTLVDHCTGALLIEPQIILIEDNTAPTIVCPPDLTVGTDTGICSATVVLDVPTGSDDCGNVSFSAIGSYGASGFGPHPGIPLGIHTVTYTVDDNCGNQSTCQISVTVIDDEVPQAVCDEITNVSLTTTGITMVPAATFDDGSHDNCAPITFLASRDGITFGPFVNFDCDDLLVPLVNVTMRVIEIGNPNSFIDCNIVVEVEDKLVPVIQCPAGVTIDCDADFSNLNDFGTPTLFDNCGATTVENSTETIDGCGEGTIMRTFTATDSSGNSSSCSQVITIENLTPYDGSGIIWPPDYTTYEECTLPDLLDPDDLPSTPNYNEPIINGATCGLIATNYSDMQFNIQFPACYKIVRTWTVIDWCQYNPDDPVPTGIWENQQLVKVLDDESPIITFSPVDSLFGIDNNCGVGVVSLQAVTATDCSPTITITNDSPYAYANGADASGDYPDGETVVTYSVEDGCGNKTITQVTVEVADIKPPTPYCSGGINAELQFMGNGGMASISAEMLDVNSFDNCTGQDDLVFTMQLTTDTLPGPPSSSELIFDCDDIGMHEVELWVIDEAGNSDYCITIVEIQNNMGACGDPNVGMIEGEVDNEMGEEVEEVTVHVMGSNAFPNTTGLTGSFAFPSVPLGGDYTVMPKKDMEHLNGVTTFDMVLMGRHILGIELLDSPYKIIAADINKSGTITTFDMVELRKVILQIYTSFPQNDSWRFVDKEYEFPNPADPFFPPFPEDYNIDNMTQAQVEANFTGMKVGDLNDSAIPNTLLGADDRNVIGTVRFLLENKEVIAGQSFQVDFKAEDFQEMLGYQFSLKFDHNALVFNEFEQGALESMKEENLGFALLDEGIITTSWFDLDKPSLDEDEILFSLKFTARTNGQLVDFIELKPTPTVPEAYTGNDEQLDIEIQFSKMTEQNMISNFELLQNQPNPFKKETNIGFVLPEPASGRLTIFDLSGKVLKTISQDFSGGYNEIQIERTELPIGGVLYYQLETATHTATKKMILLN